jgi:hypothetical protein
VLALLLGISGVTTVALARPGEDAAVAGEAANSASAAPASPVAAELQELKDEVRAQTKLFAAHSQELESERVALQEELARIESLEAKVGVAADTAVSSIGEGDPQSSAPPAQPQTLQNQGNVDRRLGNLEARLKKIGPLSFSGDFRFREEPLYGGPADRSLDQNRQRIRLRFNTEADLGAGVTGGFSLASGDVNNPISTNQDVTAFYTRKPIALDKAFVQYRPTFFKPLTLVAGKFG